MMRTVLVFDSSAVICHTVSKQLRTYGFDTIQARSLSSARAALASRTVDLVILGLAPLTGGAPDAGGMALLRELKQACAAGAACQRPPVVILTSSARDSDRLAAHAAGAIAFLTKPVSTRELLYTVNSVLGVPALQVPTARPAVTGGAIVRAPSAGPGAAVRSPVRHVEGMHP